MNKEIVIAAYDKSLNWVDDINTEIKKTIYRKGDILPLKDNEIKITPNKGRCVHTFFNHIYLNYENLSDYTFFVQDYPFDHWGNLIDVVNSDVNKIETLSSLKIDGYFGFHNNTLGTSWKMYESQQFGNGLIISCQSNGHPQDLNPNINLDKYWKILFSDEHTPPHNYEFIPGGHFVITKEQIKIRSKEFYKQVITLLMDNEHSPWNFERLECYIFNKNYKTKL
jgi:hypothetical protein